MEFLIIIGLIILNGVLAMSEIAMVSPVNPVLKQKPKSKTNRTKSIKISESTGSIPLDHTDRNHVNRYPYRSLFRASPRWRLGRMGGKISVATSCVTHIKTLIVIVVTYLTLIFGELVPKRIGMVARKEWQS